MIEDDVDIGPLSHGRRGHARPDPHSPRRQARRAGPRRSQHRRSARARSSRRSAGFAGSVKIGRGVLVGGQAGIADHVVRRRRRAHRRQERRHRRCTGWRHRGRISGGAAHAVAPRARATRCYGRALAASAGCSASRVAGCDPASAVTTRRSRSTGSSQILPHRWPFVLVDRVTEVVARRADRRAQVRDDGRAVVPGALPGAAHHARGAHPRGARPDRRDPRVRERALRRVELAHVLPRDRQGEVPPPGHAGRPARSRGDGRSTTARTSGSSAARRPSTARCARRPSSSRASSIANGERCLVKRQRSAPDRDGRPPRRARRRTSRSGRLRDRRRRACILGAGTRAPSARRRPRARPSSARTTWSTHSPSSAASRRPSATRRGAGRLEIGDTTSSASTSPCTAAPTARATRIGSHNLFMVGVARRPTTSVVGSHCVSRERRAARRARRRRATGRPSAASRASPSTYGSARAPSSPPAPMCERDVPPFVIVQGDRARVRGLNVVGLRRRGDPEEASDHRAERAVAQVLDVERPARRSRSRALEGDRDAYVEKLLGFGPRSLPDPER